MRCGVTLAIAATMARPSTGVPSASKTTTPSPVTTKPALDMNPLFASEATPASPCRNQQCSETRCGVNVISCARARGAQASITHQPTARTRRISGDLHAEHHAAVLVLEVVAMHHLG